MDENVRHIKELPNIMKGTGYLLIIIIFVSCNQGTGNKTIKRQSSDSTRFGLDSVEYLDSNISRIQKSDTQINYPLKNKELNSKTDSFLSKPFNLYLFKKKKNGSLSGGSPIKSYYFKPAFKGIYYRFNMFEPKTVNYIVDGREMRHSNVGYIGTNKQMISFREDGLLIVTFQPNDKFRDMYLNPNEILIDLIARYNDFDLPELAFVGLDSIEIKKQLGQETFYKNNCLVYTKDNIALILKLFHRRVEWIRYIVLAKKLEFETEINDLYKVD
jgi:hypothetical protein